ncbi:MAG: ATP-dependent protease LonB [Nanoarchaeota archaeon]
MVSKYVTTKDIPVSPNIIGQVIGQEEAVEVVKKAAQQRRHVLLIGDPGTGKCVGQDTSIITDRGPIKACDLFEMQAGEVNAKDDGLYARPIGMLQVASIELSGKVGWKKVTCMYKGGKKLLHRITLRSGIKFEVSGDHPLLTIFDGKPVFIDSHDLACGMPIGVVRNIPWQRSNALLIDLIGFIRIGEKFSVKRSNGVTSTPITIPRVISLQLAYFLGLYIAKGRWQGNMVISNQSTKLQEKVKRVLIEEFSYPEQLIKMTKDAVIVKKSTALITFLHQAFQIPLETTQQSSLKCVPNILYTATPEVIGSFLSGYIDGDGYVTRKHGIACVSKSKELVKGISLLLLGLGVRTRIKEVKKRATNLEQPLTTYYSIQIPDSKMGRKIATYLQLEVDYKKNSLIDFVSKKANTNVDVIPSVEHHLYKWKRELGAHYKDLGIRHVTLRRAVRGERGLSQEYASFLYEKLLCFAPLEISPTQSQLQTLIHGDLFWDRLDTIEIVEKTVYDFQVQGTHNFVIEQGVVVHNSMLGLALAELLPKEKLLDTVSFQNPNDENQPLIRTVPAGQGRELVANANLQSLGMFRNQNFIILVLAIIAMVTPWWARTYYKSDIMFTAFFLGGMIFLAAFAVMISVNKRVGGTRFSVPKLIVDNYKRKTAPFHDATGAHAGALLGDVLHDPFQCIPGNELVILSNGKPTPIADLVEPLFVGEGEYELEDSEQFELLAAMPQGYGYTPATVKSVFRRKFNGDLITIKNRRGYTIRVTPKHPIAVFTPSGTIDFVPAGSIESGMISIVPNKLPITVQGRLSSSFIKFLAEVLSDGSIRDKSITFKVRTPWKAALFESSIRSQGIKPKTIRRGKDIEIYAHSAKLVHELRALGIVQHKRKSVPSILFSLPRDQIMEFLSRYISIDGYVGTKGQFEVLSKEMIPDLCALLLKIGVQAKMRPRVDTGFGKEQGTIQPRLIFGDFEFAKTYATLTVNPRHKRNLGLYLEKTAFHHVSFDDVIPISFDLLERIRAKTGLSKTKVHKAYYALNSLVGTHHAPTRSLLRQITEQFLSVTNGFDLFKLRDVAQGTFSYDEIIHVGKESYSGYVYNLKTSTGTYLVSQVLTHNSGGLGTPAHERVVAGMIHKANMGVLFIDEIATLAPYTQQELLTALQEGKFPITGQSERSAGAMVRTEPVPCNFILVAAGNLETIKNMHPALRSRIRGYGYEVYMKDTIKDTPENQERIAIFVAQEVVKDKKIPHFDRNAVNEIIQEAKRMANRKGHLTMRFRELGGLIRAAGDLAVEDKSNTVSASHIKRAKRIARTLEKQLADQYIERKKEYDIIITSGKRIGRVNGLAVIGTDVSHSGIILPIESEVTPGGKEREIIATGKLGEIAKEAIKNVSAIIKKYFGEDIKETHDIYVQFLQTYEGVEGDSASIAVATSIISALKKIPIKQNYAMTGSLSVRGEVLPVGGVSSKVEAAIDAGISHVIVPKSNGEDIVIEPKKLSKIKLIQVETIEEVLSEVMDWKGKEAILKKIKTWKK